MTYVPHAALFDKKPSVARGFGTSVAPANLTVRSDGLHRQGYSYGRTLSDQDLSFFDFEPAVASFQLQGTISDVIGPDPVSAWNENDRQLISPPNSAVFSPKAWPDFEFLREPPPNILTDVKPASKRTNYGQITPTDDEQPEPFGRAEKQPQTVNEAAPTGNKKRKRASVAVPEPSTPVSKRSKKDVNRVELHGNSPTDPSNQEVSRRSKFLERNRVAASKCRQKKKQWVENLETKARNLQAQYKHLNLVVDSLKEEILYLKVEMMRHKDCEGSEIQKFIKGEGGAFAEAEECLARSEREGKTSDDVASSPQTGNDRDLVQPPKDRGGATVFDQSSSSPLPLDDLELAEALLQDGFYHNDGDLIPSELGSSRAVSVLT